MSNIYYDTVSSGRITGSGNGCTTYAGGRGVVGKIPRQLQTVTGYTDIFSAWNANLDGEACNDDTWELGNGMQYTRLKYKGMSLIPQNSQAMGIPDSRNAPITSERVGVSLLN